ncbi:MAG: PIN domain-containing protein [Selenomonadaceae bacterium]|nr:PIN domain-containing protein [Selenomonadaceae bacterium]
MAKILIDTNVVLRYLLRDHPKQSMQAKKAVEIGAVILPEVLVETVHALKNIYRVDRQTIAASLMTLLNEVEIERKQVMVHAVELYADSQDMDFMDCIIIAYFDIENIRVFTFDPKLNRVPKS